MVLMFFCDGPVEPPMLSPKTLRRIGSHGSHHSFECTYVPLSENSFYNCLNAIVRIEGRSKELVML